MPAKAAFKIVLQCRTASGCQSESAGRQEIIKPNSVAAILHVFCTGNDEKVLRVPAQKVTIVVNI